MASYIAPIGRGMGDLIISLPVIQSLISAGEKVYIVMRSERHVGIAERVPGLAGAVRERDLDFTRVKIVKKENLYLSEIEDRYINLREHP